MKTSYTEEVERNIINFILQNNERGVYSFAELIQKRENEMKLDYMPSNFTAEEAEENCIGYISDMDLCYLSIEDVFGEDFFDNLIDLECKVSK